MESKRIVKRAPRLNAKSAKIRKRLDFSGDEFLEKILSDIATSSMETNVSSAEPVEIKLPLGNNRFLVYNVYGGADKFHVRQYEEKKGLLVPTLHGVCMSEKRFAAFC